LHIRSSVISLQFGLTNRSSASYYHTTITPRMGAPRDFAARMPSNISSHFRGACAPECTLSTKGELRFAATSCVILLPINGRAFELITKFKQCWPRHRPQKDHEKYGAPQDAGLPAAYAKLRHSNWLRFAKFEFQVTTISCTRYSRPHDAHCQELI
jgi:hypothetical protein